MRSRSFFSIRNMVLMLVLLVAMLVAMFMSSRQVSGSMERESLRIAEQAINRALVTCYATEGSYPAEFSYLEETYGVHIDHSRFLVEYDIFASNIMPSVRLIDRKAASENEQ